MRLNIFHYPIQNWCDAVTMNTLMGSATVIQLEELRNCSYQPLADAMADILSVEQNHAEQGRIGLQQWLAAGFDKSAVQASVEYWYPRVAATFGRIGTERFETYRRFGLRRHSNEELLARWQDTAATILAGLQLAA
jgi:1,2-phenylacetyl-CoA epoxidase catalytic subunit